MPMKAPSISNCPCAKLTIWTVLKIKQQAERDEGVDAPEREAIDDELTHRRLQYPASLIGPISSGVLPLLR